MDGQPRSHGGFGEQYPNWCLSHDARRAIWQDSQKLKSELNFETMTDISASWAARVVSSDNRVPTRSDKSEDVPNHRDHPEDQSPPCPGIEPTLLALDLVSREVDALNLETLSTIDLSNIASQLARIEQVAKRFCTILEPLVRHLGVDRCVDCAGEIANLFNHLPALTYLRLDPRAKALLQILGSHYVAIDAESNQAPVDYELLDEWSPGDDDIPY